MAFSGCGSYGKDICDSDEYVAMVKYVQGKLEGIMFAFK